MDVDLSKETGRGHFTAGPSTIASIFKSNSPQASETKNKFRPTVAGLRKFEKNYEFSREYYDDDNRPERIKLVDVQRVLKRKGLVSRSPEKESLNLATELANGSKGQSPKNESHRSKHVAKLKKFQSPLYSSSGYERLGGEGDSFRSESEGVSLSNSPKAFKNSSPKGLTFRRNIVSRDKLQDLKIKLLNNGASSTTSTQDNEGATEGANWKDDSNLSTARGHPTPSHKRKHLVNQSLNFNRKERTTTPTPRTRRSEHLRLKLNSEEFSLEALNEYEKHKNAELEELNEVSSRQRGFVIMNKSGSYSSPRRGTLRTRVKRQSQTPTNAAVSSKGSMTARADHHVYEKKNRALGELIETKLRINFDAHDHEAFHNDVKKKIATMRTRLEGEYNTVEKSFNGYGIIPTDHNRTRADSMFALTFKRRLKHHLPNFLREARGTIVEQKRREYSYRLKKYKMSAHRGEHKDSFDYQAFLDEENDSYHKKFERYLKTIVTKPPNTFEVVSHKEHRNPDLKLNHMPRLSAKDS